MGGVDLANQRLKTNSSIKAVRVKKSPTKLVEYAAGINTNHGHIHFQVTHPVTRACDGSFICIN